MRKRAIAGRLVLAATCLVLAVSARHAAGQEPAPTPLEAALDRATKLLGERKFDEALAAADEALALAVKSPGPESLEAAAALNMLGFVEFSRGGLDAAERHFGRALAIRRARQAEPDALFASLNNLASVIQQRGRLGEVEPLLAEALKTLELAKASAEQLAIAHNNLGGLYTVRGDYARARQAFERAAELWRSVKSDHPRLGFAYNNLGLVSQAVEDFPAAERFYTQALAIREPGGETLDLARTLNNLGSAYQEQGRLADAEPLYARALAIHEKLGESADQGQLLNNVAVLRLLQKNYEAAGPLYTRALDMRTRLLGGQHPDVATSLSAYAIYLFVTGQAAEAVAMQSRATDIVERNLALVIEVGSEVQKERYLRLFADSIDVTLWMRASVPPGQAVADRAALQTVLTRKGRIQDVLAASSQALRAAARDSDAAVLDDLSAARARLAVLVLQAPGPAAARQAQIAELEERIDSLERTMSAASAAARTAPAVTLDEVQSRIPAGSVLVEYFRYRPFDPHATRVADRFLGPPRYAAAALRRTGAPVWTELGEAAAIDTRIAALRGALVNPRRSDVIDRARPLTALLVEGLAALAGDATDVLLAPDGDLNLVPFQALVDGTGRFLLDRYRFTYLTSGRDLLARETAVAQAPPVVIANPAFGAPGAAAGAVSRAFTPLPGAEREATQVAGFLPGTRVLRGAEASEGALKALRSPRILHVATHGFFLSGNGTDAVAGARTLRPTTSAPAWTTLPPLLRSGLALADANTGGRDGEDGILTASEAAMLDLRGTDLVFLSACESGLGVVNAGESVYGLRRALVIAGARAQVMTLWQIADESAQVFVGDFYRALAGGATRSEALREAQRRARGSDARSHPFYWAAFIVSGDGGALTR
jgi:CHAT domain-containing protein/Tfp pilus assembly protein PilF